MPRKIKVPPHRRLIRAPKPRGALLVTELVRLIAAQRTPKGEWPPGFLREGKPDAEKLDALFDWPVTPADRDAAWEAYQKLRAAQASPEPAGNSPQPATESREAPRSASTASAPRDAQPARTRGEEGR